MDGWSETWGNRERRNFMDMGANAEMDGREEKKMVQKTMEERLEDLDRQREG